MARFSLQAVGRDRPGIVAAVARALAGLGCNLEDSRMTILAGDFSVMLVLSAPDGCDAAAIEAAVTADAGAHDLLVTVRPSASAADGGDDGEVLAVSVHGADHPGIVARIAGEIAGGGGNIVDLQTRVVPSPDGDSYVMVLTVLLPHALGVDALEQRLQAAARDAGVHCVVSPADAELL